MIKKNLKEVLYNSLAQATIRLYLTPRLIHKLFLVVFILCSSSLASFLVIQSILQYYTYGVSTTSRNIYETPTLFPKVTLCNYNRFTTKYSFDLIQKLNVSNVENLLPSQHKLFSHKLDDVLFFCLFNGKYCDAGDFTWAYNEQYGNCYTFNSGFDSNGNKSDDIKESNIAGPLYGLQLVFYINVYEKLLDLMFGSMPLITNLGALIQIGNNSKYASYYSNDGVFISPGFFTYIAVEREFKSMLPKPYSDCEIDTNAPKMNAPEIDLYTIIVQSCYEYSQQLCFSQCLQKQSIARYNCSLPLILTLFKEVDTCLIDFDGFIVYFSKLTSEHFFNSVCLPVCPLECSQTLYKTSMSFNHLNDKHHLFSAKIENNPNLSCDFINRPISDEHSLAGVNIFYSSLSYKSTTESPQTNVITLLASIGGNLSLFLGVSMFSLCEIIEVFIELFYILISRKNPTKQIEQIS